jgi:hypothetical protein
MPASRVLTGVLLVFAAIPAGAQGTLGGALAPELLRYLQLSSGQAANMNQLAAAWTATVQEKTREADQLRSEIQAETGRDQPDPAVLGADYVKLEMICRSATAARNDLLQNTRAVLSADQLARIQALEDALNLMPRVIEAQRAGLIPDFIQTSPIGLPAGQITVSLAFAAATPAPLPGCLAPAVQAQPGNIPSLRRR